MTSITNEVNKALQNPQYMCIYYIHDMKEKNNDHLLIFMLYKRALYINIIAADGAYQGILNFITSYYHN